jgi:hypothetical protein
MPIPFFFFFIFILQISRMWCVQCPEHINENSTGKVTVLFFFQICYVIEFNLLWKAHNFVRDFPTHSALQKAITAPC